MATVDYTSSLISKAATAQFTNPTTDPATCDFSLIASSDCEDAGTGSLALDISGASRDVSPDVGAWEFTVSGTTYEVTSTFAVTQTVTDLGQAIADGIVSLTTQVDDSDGGDALALTGVSLSSIATTSNSASATTVGSTTLANTLNLLNGGDALASGILSIPTTLNITPDASATALTTLPFPSVFNLSFLSFISIEVSAQLSTTSGLTASGQAIGSGGINLNITQDAVVSAIASSVATMLLANSQTIAATATAIISDSLSLGNTLATSNIGTLVVDGTITLPATLSNLAGGQANTEASSAIAAQVGLSIIAQAAASAGITIASVSSIMTQGTLVVVGVVTPEGRTINISIDSRIVLVATQDRIINIT